MAKSLFVVEGLSCWFLKPPLLGRRDNCELRPHTNSLKFSHRCCASICSEVYTYGWGRGGIGDFYIFYFPVSFLPSLFRIYTRSLQGGWSCLFCLGGGDWRFKWVRLLSLCRISRAFNCVPLNESPLSALWVAWLGMWGEEDLLGSLAVKWIIWKLIIWVE